MSLKPTGNTNPRSPKILRAFLAAAALALASGEAWADNHNSNVTTGTPEWSSITTSLTLDLAASNVATIGRLGVLTTDSSVTISGSSTVVTVKGHLAIGRDALTTGVLTLTTGGTISLSPNSGTAVLYLAPTSDVGTHGTGTINIGAVAGGTAAAPGFFAGSFTEINGNGTLQFKYTNDSHEYYLTSGGTNTGTPLVLTDAINVIHNATGATTYLLGDNNTTGSFTINAGKVVLGGTNDGGILLYPSATVASGATLQIGNGGATGTFGANITNNGTVIFDRTGTYTYSSAINGTGGVTKDGSGTVSFTSDQNYYGPTIVKAGKLFTEDNFYNSSSFTIYPNAKLEVESHLVDAILSPINGNITNNGELILSPQASLGGFLYNPFLALNNTVSGSGKIIKQGTGDLTVVSNNSYSGGTDITNGRLYLGLTPFISLPSPFDNGYPTSGTLGTGPVNISNGAGLYVDRTDTFTLVNNITGAGSFHQYGSGKTILTGVLTEASGTFYADSGDIQIGNDTYVAPFSANIIVSSGKHLTFKPSNNAVYSGVITSPSTVTFDGTGKTILTGANIYSGTSAVKTGASLQIGNGTDAGSLGAAYTGGMRVFDGTITLEANSNLIFASTQAQGLLGNAIQGGGNGAVSVAAGARLVLAANAQISAASFVLATGATLSGGDAAGGSGGGAVNAATITIATDAVLDPSNRGTSAGTVSATTNPIGQFKLTGAVGITNATYKLDLNSGASFSSDDAPASAQDRVAITGAATASFGTVDITDAASSFRTGVSNYTILTTTTGLTTDAANLAATTFKLNGTDLESQPLGSFVRRNRAALVQSGDNDLVLKTYSNANIRLTWDGTDTSSDAWDTSAVKWKDSVGAPLAFLNYDVVTFPQGAAAKTVALTGGDVVVREMTVTGSGYTFTSEANQIEGTAQGGTDNLAAYNAQGRLIIAAGVTGTTFDTAVSFAQISISGEAAFNGATTATGGLDVLSGGVLAGTGPITGAVDIANGGTLSPAGDGTGTIAFDGSVTLHSGAALVVAFSASGTDAVTVEARSGGLTFEEGSKIYVTLDNSLLTGTTFSLEFIIGSVSFGGELKDIPPELVVLSGGEGWHFEVQYTSDNKRGVTLSGTLIPEPSTYGLFGLGLMAALAAVRRRRRQQA